MTRRDDIIAKFRTDPTIQNSIKSLAESLEIQNPNPLQLKAWVSRVFAEGRRLNHSDKEISRWVKVYARKGYWSTMQVKNAIIACGGS
ncbi:MAG TPA: hypothetical protein VFJ05_06990 [Nitrososphaeraceae archaeon]|nr:hypothetical protein [Nitrososphaeraceae archaeon]